MASTHRFIDLFAGVGGFHIALSSLDANCVFASDIDETCRDTYEVNFGVRPEGDIRPLTEGRTVDIPDHDFLCAGFPCQPFSKSGHQLGINETRGTLFYNILRILEAKRPRYVLLENVRNIAGPRHRNTWETIIRNLRLLGYRVSDSPTIASPHNLPPWMGGRPQIRERVFIAALYVGEGTPESELRGQPLLPNRPVDGWDPQEWRIEDYLQADREIDAIDRYALRPAEVAWLDTWNELLQRLPAGRLPGFPLWADHFVADPVIPTDSPNWKREFLLKNASFYRDNVTVIDEWLARKNGLMDLPASRRKLEWQAQDSPRDLWQLVMHLRPSGIRVKRATYLPALVAIAQTSVIGWRRRRITPREAARLQAFPDDFKLHGVDSVAYRHLGNAVNVGVVAHLASLLLAETGMAAPREEQLELMAAS